MVDVVCVGDTAIDDYYSVPKLPGPDEKVHARYTGRSLGGTTCNTSRALHRLGANVLFLTRLGDDEHGRYAEEQFSKAGLATRCLRSRETPSTQILVAQDGEKAILLHGFAGPPQWSEEELAQFLEPVPARALFSNLSLPVRERLLDFRAHLVISLEPAVVEWDRQAFPWSCRHAHTVILDRHTFRLLFQKEPSPESISQAFDALPEPPQRLITTLGARGCLGLSRSPRQVHQVPSFDVKVVDTTGAGDTFSAAYLFSCFIKDAPFQECLRYANAIAAASCENHGTELTPEVLAAGEKLYKESRQGTDA